MTTYQLTTGGVIRDATTFVPNSPGNTDWAAYQAWVTAGNTASAAASLSFPDYQAAATAKINDAAEGQRKKWLAGGSGLALVQALRFAEAVAMSGDGSPSSGTYPLLNYEVGTTGGTLALVGTAVRAELATLKGHLGAIEAVRVVAIAAIAAAGGGSAVDAAVAAAVWP